MTVANLDRYYHWRHEATRLREAALRCHHDDAAKSFRQIARSYDVLADSEAFLLGRISKWPIAPYDEISLKGQWA